MKPEINIIGKDLNLRKNDQGNLSLNDIWLAAGSPKSKDPRQWVRLESTTQLIETVAEIYNVQKIHIIKTRKGKGGGSFAHKNIALAYAKYLDPKLHVLVNQTFFERIEEEKNPDLTVDRAIRSYKKKGKSDEWINARLKSKLTRNTFTSALKAHGVQNEGFKHCTNAIYEPLFGGTTAVVRMKKGLDKSDSIRDNLTGLELSAVEFSEALARDKIQRNEYFGNAECEMASRNSSRIVADAIKKSKL